MSLQGTATLLLLFALLQTAQSIATCPCNPVRPGNPRLFPSGDGTCFEDDTRPERCFCEQSGTQTCEISDEIDYVRTGKNGECEQRTLQTALCPSSEIRTELIHARLGTTCTDACGFEGLVCDAGKTALFAESTAERPITLTNNGAEYDVACSNAGERVFDLEVNAQWFRATSTFPCVKCEEQDCRLLGFEDVGKISDSGKGGICSAVVEEQGFSLGCVCAEQS
mmetsp:Transcript_23799/g.59148  ORF Transcript_23799/g.59148 Transcript_23799/m.59148 type:complete len:224 (+) Transcript_23799:66-737(+)